MDDQKSNHLIMGLFIFIISASIVLSVIGVYPSGKQFVKGVISENVPLDSDEASAEAELIAGLDPNIDEEGAKNLVGEAYRSGRNSKYGGTRITYLSCSDTDNGKDFEKAGTVTSTFSYKGKEQTKTFNDACNENRLTEYYCRGNRYSKTSARCDNGCSNEACVAAKKSVVGPNCQELYDKALSAHGSTCGSSSYDPIVDIDKDKIVSANDVTKIASKNNDEAWCSNTLQDNKNPCAISSTCQNLLDRALAAMGSTCLSDNYDPVADVNKDKWININDVSTIANSQRAWCFSALRNDDNPCAAFVGAITDELEAISVGDKFVVKGTSQGDTVLRYTGSNKISSVSPIINFIIEETGYKTPWTMRYHPEKENKVTTLIFDGKSYEVFNLTSSDLPNFDIRVDMNADGELR